MFEKSLQNLREIKEINDPSKLVLQLQEAEENLKLAEKKLQDANERWEFDSIQSDVSELKWSIQQLKNKISNSREMSHLKEFSKGDAISVVKAFNSEVASAEKTYKQASSKIIDQFEKLSKELATTSSLLADIETAAINVQEILNYLPAEFKNQLKTIELQRVKKSNLQVVTLSKQLSLIQQQLNEVGGVK